MANVNCAPPCVAVAAQAMPGQVAPSLPPSVATSAYSTAYQTELGYAAGVPYTRVTALKYDRTGALISTIVVYRNSAGAETGTMPTGFMLGSPA